MFDKAMKRITSECRDELDIIKRALAANGLPATDEEAIKSALAAHAHFASHPDAIVITRAAMESSMLNFAVHAVEQFAGRPFVPVKNDDGTFSFGEVSRSAH